MKHYCIIILIFSLITACSKSEFLNVKPNQSLVIPNSLDDLQAILDHDLDMNGVPRGLGLVPQILDIASDDYYVLDQGYRDRLDDLLRMYYRWDAQANTADMVQDWERPYLCVLNSNLVLDHLEEMKDKIDDVQRWNEIRGAALFYRAHAFYHLAQVYAYPYGDENYDKYGIPLRLSSDISETIFRSSVSVTYKKIIDDLIESSELLPENELYKERPSKVTAYAMLARVFLAMRDYDQALLYSDRVLNIKNTLLDYNDLNPADPYPFNQSEIMDREVLFKSSPVNYSGKTSPLAIVVARIDSVLYDTYEEEDLRKNIFFITGSVQGFRFKGSYFGANNLFAGIALDEIYLIKAESLVKIGQTIECVKVLDNLRKNRYRKGTESYKVPQDIMKNEEELLKFVRLERRKQLIFRSLRWTDLRRFNLEGANITLQRQVDAQEYSLSSGDKRWAFLIPQQVMGFNPTMLQNPR